jgi:hypothetical protein
MSYDAELALASIIVQMLLLWCVFYVKPRIQLIDRLTPKAICNIRACVATYIST